MHYRETTFTISTTPFISISWQVSVFIVPNILNWRRKNKFLFVETITVEKESPLFIYFILEGLHSTKYFEEGLLFCTFSYKVTVLTVRSIKYPKTRRYYLLNFNGTLYQVCIRVP